MFASEVIAFKDMIRENVATSRNCAAYNILQMVEDVDMGHPNIQRYSVSERSISLEVKVNEKCIKSITGE